MTTELDEAVSDLETAVKENEEESAAVEERNSKNNESAPVDPNVNPYRN